MPDEPLAGFASPPRHGEPNDNFRLSSQAMEQQVIAGQQSRHEAATAPGTEALQLLAQFPSSGSTSRCSRHRSVSPGAAEPPAIQQSPRDANTVPASRPRRLGVPGYSRLLPGLR